MSVKNFITSLSKYLFCLLFLLPFNNYPALAQKYFFDNYGVKQGLKRQKVYTMLQDSKDYFWFGTFDGVSRFDGKNFENFSIRDGLANGGVKCISEDRSGNIWFGHLNGGISRFDGIRFDTIAFDSLRLSGDITGINQINNKIWFTSINEGAIQADFPVSDFKNIKAKRFGGKEGLSDQVFGSYVFKDGTFVCIADAGLRRYSEKGNLFENFRLPHMTTYFSVTCLLEEKNGNILFGTYNGGLFKYRKEESTMELIDLREHGIPSNWVTCLMQDRKGRLWVGTWDGGVAEIDGENIRKFNSENGLTSARIYAIIEDLEGNILIADQNNGITIFKGDAFQSITDSEFLPDPKVNAVYQDKTGAIWLGTGAGICRFYPHSAKRPVYYNHQNSGINEDIRFFKEDMNGNLWIGANEGGVIMFNMKTSKFEPQPYINSVMYRGGQVKALDIDKQNHLWIGTVEGVEVGTIGEKDFQRYTLMDSLNVSFVTSQYCDPNGDMWIGIENRRDKPGLIRYISSESKFKLVNSFQGITPVTMVMDKKGILWAGTDYGLYALRNDSVITMVTKDSGLLSNTINLLATDESGSIYIGTDKGLNRYFPETNRFFSYTERNGFPGIETMPNAVLKSRDSTIWFGTSNGVTLLNPDKLITEGPEAMTHIMDMRVNYELRELTPGLKLKHNENTVLFDYYSICLTNPDVVRFKVKLDGAEKDWRPVTDQTRVIYSALTPGKYTFNVIASNSQGIWNKNPIKYSFTILAPFYKKWWFITLMVALIAGILIFIIRSLNLSRDKKILEVKVKERTNELAQKNLELEDKNRNITSSIVYAERIQRAMLPKVDDFNDSFVLFLPKDIVSGDFYWMYETEENLFIAAVDCTGHGVPGALMSMIGHNSLNKIIKDRGLTKPSEILDQLNIEVTSALLQRHEKEIKDGMDISLFVFNRKKFTLEFAGAFNPLYILRQGEVIVFKGDKFPIGLYTIDYKIEFANHLVDIKSGDMLYLFSDGYADQFGYRDGKKFKTKNTKRVLAEIWHLPLDEQKNKLQKEIMDWKGPLEQVDDILFIGTRIP